MATHASEPLVNKLADDDGKRRAARQKAKARREARRKSGNRKQHADIPRLSFSPDEWCAAHNFSRSYYEKLKREKRGPRELRDGKIVRITPEADREWQAAREKQVEVTV